MLRSLSILVFGLLAVSSAYSADFPEFCDASNPVYNLGRNELIPIIQGGNNPNVCVYYGSGSYSRFDLRDFTLAGKYRLILNSNSVSASDAVELAAHGTEIVILNHLVKPGMYSVEAMEAMALKGKVSLYLNGSDRFYADSLARLAKAGVAISILSGVNGYTLDEVLRAAKVSSTKPVQITLYMNGNGFSPADVMTLAGAGVKIIP